MDLLSPRDMVTRLPDEIMIKVPSAYYLHMLLPYPSGDKIIRTLSALPNIKDGPTPLQAYYYVHHMIKPSAPQNVDVLQV